MTRTLSLLMMLLAVGLFAACGDKPNDGDAGQDGDEGQADGNEDDEGGHGHGAAGELGSIEIGKQKVTVALFGSVEAGNEAVIDIKVEGAAPEAVRAWIGVESAAGSLKAKPDLEGDSYHGHVMAPDPLPEGSHIWVELENADGSRGNGAFAIPEHGHIGPHEGMIAAFECPATKSSGFLELKLHDDKGDLELWLATDDEITKPFDLASTAEISVTFESHDGKVVTLKARDQDKNPDEDGAANMRGGKTNYFIFPGETGADAAWLMGKAFKDQVTVTFSHDGASYATAEFELIPHGHGPGGHSHN